MRLIVELVIDTGQRYRAELGPHGGNVKYARLEVAQHASLLRAYHVAAIDLDTGEVLLWRIGVNVAEDDLMRSVLGPNPTATNGRAVGYEAFHIREEDAFAAWGRWWTIVRGADGRPERMES